jgi:gag-polypeptide of LTR copia-type
MPASTSRVPAEEPAVLPAAPPPPPTLPSITIAPAIQASLVLQIELLDKSKNNWTKWKRVVVQCLGMVGLDDYLTGAIACPDATIEPRAAANWRTNDKVVRSFLGLKASEEEQEYIESHGTTADVWSSLKSRHEQEGLITQILLIQEALNVRYLKSERLSAVSTKLSDLNSRIFAIGIPTKDVFLSILMLNSLSGELSNVRDYVTTSLSSSNTFTSNDIRKQLDTEQQIIDSDMANLSRTVAEVLISHPRRSVPSKSTKSCQNCKKAGRRYIGHSDDTCYHKGGAMEGQRDRVEANRKRHKGSRNARYDSSGRAFILDKDTGEAFYLAPSNLSSNVLRIPQTS